MKLNIVLPWICVLGLTAGLAAVYVSGRAKDTELTRLRDDLQQAQATRDELDQLRTQTKTQQDEIAAFRTERAELLRLRNEVNRFRDEKAQLEKKLQTAQGEVQRAQTGAQQVQQQLQSANEQLRSATAAQSQAIMQQRVTCVNNLRLLDGAKQQWALQNQRTAEAVPTAQDLAPYLNNTLPACPAGGTYSLNAVGHEAACSISGHALPR